MWGCEASLRISFIILTLCAYCDRCGAFVRDGELVETLEKWTWEIDSGNSRTRFQRLLKTLKEWYILEFKKTKFEKSAKHMYGLPLTPAPLKKTQVDFVDERYDLIWSYNYE